MTAVLIAIAAGAALIVYLTSGRRYDHGIATIQYGYGKTHSYRARRERETGRVQIWVREWMPAQPPGRDDAITVTFTKTEA
jgi:hypothetical protein